MRASPACGRCGTCTEDPEVRQRLLTFVVVGGGATGVEFAGALAELIRGPLHRDHPTLPAARIVLLEAAPELLASLPPRLAGYARRRLQRMGVEVRLAAQVVEVLADGVWLQGGNWLASETVTWTAGVRGAPEMADWGLPLDRSGRVMVSPSLQVVGRDGVYVAGDMASVDAGGRPLPAIAPVAMQAGAVAADNIARELAGRPPRPFHYRNPGTLIALGRNQAMAQLFGRTFTGFPAWVLWVVVHLARLIGFRNRLLVLISWAWDYLFFDRAARVIVPGETRKGRSAGAGGAGPGGAGLTRDGARP